mmetsp:Transcript_38041/g.104645  ORF Transcript_38041/g.104645 Transcript_38041/m.104645 type:complete len:224 (-) Transcript_38041:491-1162(-)
MELVFPALVENSIVLEHDIHTVAVRVLLEDLLVDVAMAQRASDRTIHALDVIGDAALQDVRVIIASRHLVRCNRGKPLERQADTPELHFHEGAARVAPLHVDVIDLFDHRHLSRPGRRRGKPNLRTNVWAKAPRTSCGSLLPICGALVNREELDGRAPTAAHGTHCRLLRHPVVCELSTSPVYEAVAIGVQNGGGTIRFHDCAPLGIAIVLCECIRVQRLGRL